MSRAEQEKKIIYYQNELEDEFSTAQIIPKKIDDNYVYIYNSAFKKFTHFFWYRIVATPIAYIYLKIVFGHCIKNRKVLREYKKGGYVLFGNHTQDIGDAFIPTMITTPKDAYVIVHPNNVSMPVLGHVTPSLGALPLPDTVGAGKRFMKAIETRLSENNAIVIYPEAHIWPYCTKIRPFYDKSFYYPIKYGCPVFCFTNTYQKRKIGKKPRIVTYVDGPFFPDTALADKDKRRDLRDRVYSCMLERSKLSTVEYIEYRREEKHDD